MHVPLGFDLLGMQKQIAELRYGDAVEPYCLPLARSVFISRPRRQTLEQRRLAPRRCEMYPPNVSLPAQLFPIDRSVYLVSSKRGWGGEMVLQGANA